MDMSNSSDVAAYNTTVKQCHQSTNATIEQDKEFHAVLGWILVVIFLGILVFNLTVIVLIACKRKKTRLIFFVCNLAVADLLLGILFVLPEAIFNYFSVPWDKHYCYIFYTYLSIVPFYTSTYAIIALTIDRLYAIVKPMAASLKGRRYRYGLCFATWLIGLVLGIQYGAIGYFNNECRVCTFPFPGLYSKVILYLDVMVLMVVPLIIIIVSYIIIIRTIYRREKRGFVPGSVDDVQVGFQVKDKNISHAKIKTIKLLFVVAFAYTVCWMPYFIGAVLQHHGYIDKNSRTFTTLQILAPTNSLANPIVFLVFNFRMLHNNSSRKKTNTFQMSSKDRSTLVSHNHDSIHCHAKNHI